ncbi:hypothetical protein [Anabaena lutea]|uniref:Uncharacterized protein n=1 Tax=Anabaena lutea FACHB-196 TaxID=2692881 RepID=A0ABR8FCD6_9NOST|nr:hypothetical protein [Anabaena lutea]MBD2567875.1 hypothetical protein [Anabaena lutea FACHB-196]
MKFSLFTLAIVIGAISAVSIAITPRADAKPKPVSAITNQGNQAADLVTEPATINNKWNNVSEFSADSGFRVNDPECKKIDPLKYINNPDTFFQPCPSVNDSMSQNAEPVEYLKVPRLDSGLSVTVTNF